MSAAVALGDIVSEAEQIFIEAVVPLQSHFNADAIVTLDREMEHFIDRRLISVEVDDERTKTAFVLEQFFLGVAFVTQHDSHTGVQKRKFA